MNWVTRSINAVWGIYAWLCFVLAVLFAILVTLLVPGVQRRQHLATIAARAVFVMSGTKVTVNGRQNLPHDHSIVVANHASYVDGFLLKGYLPGRFNFVIKGEMRNFGPAHFVLRRSGAKFVERKEVSGSSRDARQIVRAATEGESLGIFPEGTFRKEPGVGRFRPGAFVAAVRGQLPVVPVAISGTRAMLPAERLLPRRSALTIDILPAIMPDDPDFAHSRTLAESARQRILAVLDEPDLLPPAETPA